MQFQKEKLYWLGQFLLLFPHLRRRFLNFSLHHDVSPFFNQNYMKILISFSVFGKSRFSGQMFQWRYCCHLNATLLFSKVIGLCHFYVCNFWSYLFLRTCFPTFHISSNRVLKKSFPFHNVFPVEHMNLWIKYQLKYAFKCEFNVKVSDGIL